MKLLNSRLRVVIVSLATCLALQGCSDKQVERAQLETCSRHYQAESYRVAVTECKVAAKLGFSKAEWLLANIYHYDLLEEGADLKEAFKWYLAAANNGNVSAMREVGRAYLLSSGVEEDFEEAHSWLLKAANQYDTLAEFSMGVMFLEGKGSKKDLGAAISWFKRSAIKKHTMSINNLAWVYATAQSKAFNSPKKANYWIEKLPEKHFEVPMFLDTKAAVFAAQGNFDKAIEFQNLAISKLPQDTAEEELLEYQKHLEKYQQGKPWNEEY